MTDNTEAAFVPLADMDAAQLEQVIARLNTAAYFALAETMDEAALAAGDEEGSAA
jgi:hypothetical protein